MNNLTVGNEDSFAEFAANNDVKNFKLSIQTDPSGIDQVCLWYGRGIGTKQMILLQRTPLMIACTYGSLDVVKLILSLSISDVNRICGHTTALHCAASGGSPKAVEIVKVLLEAGADHDLIDINGYRPIDVIVVSPNVHYSKSSLQELLSTDYRRTVKKEYPIDPTLPDINDGIYSTDEFRMFSFKIRPCSRAYSHDWTECPFVHPGENGRRRDPRKYHYSCVPCPDFRKGSCRRGDVCKYAHGVFECWLHPAQYRTRPCKDGTSCNRRVCFFAHAKDELRPLYVSPPISPSGNGMISNVGWPHGSNLQSSRLGLSFNARDRLAEELSMMNELSARSNTLTPMNLEELFSEYHQPTMLSPINTVFSPKGIVHSGFQMSPRNVDSPMNSRVSMLAQREQFRSFRSRELGSSSGSIVGSPSESWSQWGSMNGEADWGVRTEEFGKFRRSSSFEIENNGDEPDLSWVHSLVKESPQEMNETQSTNGAMEDSNSNSNSNNNPHLDPIDQTGLGAWLEQVQLDQLIAR
ncbi:zinc finger CCCH domain-containing protein 30-like [Impatiens glandulifera]|uniref:zinc finger CCCH domain-containing protein 30-like n=1 Tax=Impatiens glandulifera TaxID=253017 RepID=UPI001FB180F8|nr:zinc finger CCCH domain-containing protein 30-like [Impatiens glandulifera]XP_047332554.1 zinc finger CCCH domain-containing protein 30-like [Impatiens glandulifera]